MTWMERLKKNEKGHGEGATKPTKPPHEIPERPMQGGYKTYETPKIAREGGFVGLVASPDRGFQKITPTPAPDHQTGPKGGFVGFVAPILGPSQKNEGVLPDPGMARLQALAMAYCDHIGASDKARSDWHTDIEATPVEQRGELAAYLRSQLPAPMPKAMPPAVVASPSPPVPAQTWREADKADQLHYWNCAQCLAVVKTGKGTRCNTGQQLHDAYIEAA